ncbi:WD40 repeat [Dillenia turbinata]|uniref:WD40 repeat n=1 Tax=Dillenia turbinata TaxID=194707 RepID=A0AAN8VMZ1_9MAGN
MSYGGFTKNSGSTHVVVIISLTGRPTSSRFCLSSLRCFTIDCDYGETLSKSGICVALNLPPTDYQSHMNRSVLDHVGPVNSDDSVSPLLPGSFIHRNLPLCSIHRSKLMPEDHRSSSNLNSKLRTCEPELKQRLPNKNLKKKAVRGIGFPSGSEKLYTCSKDGLLQSWDCHTGQCADTNNLGCEIGSLISAGPLGFCRHAECYQGKLLVLAYIILQFPTGISLIDQVFNIDTNAEYRLTGPVELVYAITVERDVLFTGAQDGTIYALKFNPESNSFQGPALLKGHEAAVVSLVVGGNRLYSGSMDHNIKVWDIDTLQCIRTLNGHSAVVMSLLFWDQHLFSCSLDNTIKVWATSEDCNMEVIYTHNEEDVNPMFQQIASCLHIPRSPALPPHIFVLMEKHLFQGVLALCGALDAEAKPVLLCSCNDNSIHLYELPSFCQKGRISATREIRSIRIGSGGLLFTGDEAGLVTVWKWVSESGSQKGNIGHFCTVLIVQFHE